MCCDSSTPHVTSHSTIFATTRNKSRTSFPSRCETITKQLKWCAGVSEISITLITYGTQCRTQRRILYTHWHICTSLYTQIQRLITSSHLTTRAQLVYESISLTKLSHTILCNPYLDSPASKTLCVRAELQPPTSKLNSDDHGFAHRQDQIDHSLGC